MCFNSSNFFFKFQKSKKQPTEAEKVIASLEKEAKEEEERQKIGRTYRLLTQDIQFCVFMIEKHGDDYEKSKKQPTEAEKVIASLEKEAKEEEERQKVGRTYRLLTQDIQFCVFMIEKHGDDYEVRIFPGICGCKFALGSYYSSSFFASASEKTIFKIVNGCQRHSAIIWAPLSVSFFNQKGLVWYFLRH
ncbi:unnamed protein product [Gongylonema pulchrum]|uniref:RAB6-interacting golgin n=1 Tax=Gongylonema pulchrum TaxID=637853 RepID=A0A183E2N6_9BILA|nr:unnamed protein product [Gongylonema pulchrum]